MPQDDGWVQLLSPSNSTGPEYVCTGIYIWKVGRLCVILRWLWLIRLQISKSISLAEFLVARSSFVFKSMTQPMNTSQKREEELWDGIAECASSCYIFLQPALMIHRFVFQYSRITVSIHRVKDGIRNLFAKDVVATVGFEAGDPGVKEHSVYTRSGTHSFIYASFLSLTEELDSRVRANLTFEESINVKCRTKVAYSDWSSCKQREAFIKLMGKDIKSALASKVVLLDRMKNVSAFVKVVLEVGKEVSEVTIYNGCLLTKLILFSLTTWRRSSLGLRINYSRFVAYYDGFVHVWWTLFLRLSRNNKNSEIWQLNSQNYWTSN